MLAVLLGQDLIHRDVGDRRCLASHPGRAGQEGGRRAGVRRRPVAPEAGDHGHLILERRQRLKNRSELKASPLLLRGPVFHGNAIGHIDHPEAPGRGGRCA